MFGLTTYGYTQTHTQARAAAGPESAGEEAIVADRQIVSRSVGREGEECIVKELKTLSDNAGEASEVKEREGESVRRL